jgi:Family of unknown function (DUF6404)
MGNNQKRELAINYLVKLGIWKSNAVPPLLRLLWRFGLDVPPPHFGSFFRNALCLGVPFGIVYSLFMWLLMWRSMSMGATKLLLTAALAATIFGVLMASYYLYSQRKFKIPLWEDFEKS